MKMDKQGCVKTETVPSLKSPRLIDNSELPTEGSVFVSNMW